MRQGPKLAAIALLVGAVVLVNVPISGAVPKQELPEEADPILAIVSPFAVSVCAASGAATLLVPILGPVAQDQLGLGDTVSVGDLILDGLGPVFIVCGSLPANPGRRCQLDHDLAVLWPAELTTAMPAPAPLGATVDALEAGLAALGLPPEAALQDALECDVPPSATAPEPGAAPPPRPPALAIGAAPPPRPTLDAPSAPRPSPLPSAREIPQAPSAAAPAAPAPAEQERTVLELASRHVPGGILALQLLVAALLALFLGGSWLSSWRLTPRTGGGYES